MGILLKWKIPTDSDVSYDKAYIYRSTSKTGTYTEIANQSISDNVYFDIDGTTSNWYKVRFYNSSTSDWSDYSEPLQGGSFYGYCTVDDVRKLSGLTSSEISDSDLFDLISFAQAQINSELNYTVHNEEIAWISNEKDNTIDGSNTTFYVKDVNDNGYYLGDMNNDGIVDENDVEVYSVDNEGNRTNYTVSSVDPELGQFVLTSAPSSNESVYVTYAVCPTNVNEPDYLLRMATAQLASALAFTKIDAKKIQGFTIGKIKVTRQSQAFQTFFEFNYFRSWGIFPNNYWLFA